MDAPDSKWDFYWDLHVMAAVRLARGLVSGMKRRGGGVILHNASICASQPLGYEPIYNVTKAALVMFSKNLANEVVRDNIRVNTVNPGLVLDAGLGEDREGTHRRNRWRLGGASAIRGRRIRPHPPLRLGSRNRQSLRLPLLGPGELLRRLRLLRRWRHAADDLSGGASPQPSGEPRSWTPGLAIPSVSPASAR